MGAGSLKDAADVRERRTRYFSTRDKRSCQVQPPSF